MGLAQASHSKVDNRSLWSLYYGLSLLCVSGYIRATIEFSYTIRLHVFVAPLHNTTLDKDGISRMPVAHAYLQTAPMHGHWGMQR